MVTRASFGMGNAPLTRLRELCNGIDPARYTVRYSGLADDLRCELWLVEKSPGPRGSAGALYRVYLPVYSPRVLPTDLRATATCDCPEAQHGASRLGGVCKHTLMAYCWQGALWGTGARWLYTDVYLATQRYFQAMEVQHG